MQALSQNDTLAGSEFVTDSVQGQDNSAEESKGGNSAVSDFGAFQFKSSLVIQSQDIKEENSPIREENSNSSDSEHHLKANQGFEEEKFGNKQIGQINNEIKQTTPENTTTTPSHTPGVVQEDKDTLTTPSKSNESSTEEKKKQWATEPKKKVISN